MKKKWYRSNVIKTTALILGTVSLAIGAAGGAASVGIMSKGVHPFDKGDYLESRSFESSMYNYTYDLLSALAEKNFIEPEKGEEVIDLGEILENQDLTYENTSGLAYELGDLIEWSQKTDWNLFTENILACIKGDGTVDYMYYDDFAKKITDGDLEFQLDESEYISYDGNVEYARDYIPADAGKADAVQTEQILYWLRNNEFADYGYYGDARDYYDSNSGILTTGVTAVTDSKNKLIYKNIFNVESDNLIAEAFKPVGADSILDVLNEEPRWNGKIGEAYEALNDALGQVQMAKSAEVMLKSHYSQDNTNLHYILAVDVDKKNQKLETNVDTEDYQKLIESLKSGKDPFIIVGDSNDKCDTNMNLPGARDFSIWQHTIDNVGLDDGDREGYVFAAWVDKDFPVQDIMAEDAENYEKYSKWLTPSMAVCAAGIFIFIICLIILTVGAGRNNDNENVHLNFFDHWYTEIGACVSVVVWGIPFWMILMLGMNIDYIDKLKYIVILATGLGAWTAVTFLIGWLSLARRIKAKTLWKNSFLRVIWKLLVRILRKIGRMCRKSIEFFAENTASRIKMALIFTGFCFIQFVLCAVVFAGGVIFLLLLAAVDILGFIYFLRKARGRELILEGLKRITDGELQYKIPLDKLTGEQRQIADYINRIGDGLDAAVEKSLKNERMKTELITNVSHDIKTPLTSIINYVDLLKRENPQDPKIQGYLDILEEKSQRLKTLTEDVVEASKASTGNIALDMADLNFVELVHQVIGEFEERFQEKNLSMMVHFDQEEAIICADGRRMWRVLENVFSNVAKYAMENTRVYAEIKVNKPKVTFSLKNISAQPLNISADELTERFIRGDVSRNTEGSGLGLSIAKSLTELQGGEFKLYLDGDLFKVTIVFQIKEGDSKKNKEE